MKVACRSFVLSIVLLASAPWGLAAQPLGTEFQVNSATTSEQAVPAVASDSDGNFVAVWSSFQDGFTPNIFGRRFSSDGIGLGTEFEINTYTSEAQSQSVVAVDSDGDFVVVWQSYTQDGDGYGLFGQRYASDGAALGTEFLVNSYTSGKQFNPAVAADGDGDFVVIWQSDGQDDSAYAVVAQRYASSGAVLGSEFIVNTYTTNGQVLASAAADNAGNFVLVWSSQGQDGSDYGVFGQRYAGDGSALGTEFQVNTYTTDVQFGPSVASDATGNFVVVWISYTQDGDNGGVFGQVFANSGTAVGTEFQINTYTTLAQRFPSAAASPGGGFVVVWESLLQDGSTYGIFGQRLARSGALRGSEFQANTYTTDRQSTPAVAADDDGFVVLWQADEQDGSMRGIFGQRYATPSGCPANPDPGCVGGFGKGLLLVKESAGKEKLIAKLLKGPAITQADFGNPLTPVGTGYSLCIYDDAGTLVAPIEVNRAGDGTCGDGASVCWKALGGDPPDGKGYKYKDDGATADGIAQILMKGGAGTSKVIAKGSGAALPLPIAALLTATNSVTMQLRGDDAPQCFGVTLNDIKKQETSYFKAK